MYELTGVHILKRFEFRVAKVQHKLKGSYFCTGTAVRVASVQHEKNHDHGGKICVACLQHDK